jgi:hypothetical protein
MSDIKNEGKFDFIETDKRIMEQRLRKHQLSQQEYQKLLKALPDEKDQSVELEVYREGAVDTDTHSE